MHESALSVLHAAAAAIRECPDVAEATAETDHKSGEILFTLKNGQSYALRLDRLEDDEEESLSIANPEDALDAQDPDFGDCGTDHSSAG
jgi:hypothetical protein